MVLTSGVCDKADGSWVRMCGVRPHLRNQGDALHAGGGVRSLHINLLAIATFLSELFYTSEESSCQTVTLPIPQSIYHQQSESKIKTSNPQVGILITGVVAGPTVRSFPLFFNLLHSFPQVNNHFFHLFLRLGWTVHCGDVPPLCGFSGSAHWSVFACLF